MSISTRPTMAAMDAILAAFGHLRSDAVPSVTLSFPGKDADAFLWSLNEEIQDYTGGKSVDWKLCPPCEFFYRGVVFKVERKP